MKATGSSRSGSSSDLTVSEGHPESRMQAWSPVQTSSSTPNFGRTTRSPALMAWSRSGLSRRWRLSMHSEEATMTLGPFSSVVSASFSVACIRPTS